MSEKTRMTLPSTIPHSANVFFVLWQIPRTAKSYDQNDAKIELTRRAIVRALTQASEVSGSSVTHCRGSLEQKV